METQHFVPIGTLWTFDSPVSFVFTVQRFLHATQNSLSPDANFRLPLFRFLGHLGTARSILHLPLRILFTSFLLAFCHNAVRRRKQQGVITRLPGTVYR